MPELPEVETVRRGLAAAVRGRVIEEVIIRRRTLRRPLPADFARRLRGRTIADVGRRGKYLLISAPPETCIVHLGMSGALSLSPLPPAEKHAHVGFALDGAQYVIYTDPRRFGLMTLTDAPPLSHPLLAGIGVEPLTAAFRGARLAALLAGRRAPVKTALMDGRLVAGIGNIYASEALFYAGIHPRRLAGALTAEECARLAAMIKKVLRRAIAAGGSTLRDFVAADGSRGYFQVRWAVYDRAGADCVNGCGGRVAALRLGGRSSYYCPNCQPPPEVADG